MLFWQVVHIDLQIFCARSSWCMPLGCEVTGLRVFHDITACQPHQETAGWVVESPRSAKAFLRQGICLTGPKGSRLDLMLLVALSLYALVVVLSVGGTSLKAGYAVFFQPVDCDDKCWEFYLHIYIKDSQVLMIEKSCVTSQNDPLSIPMPDWMEGGGFLCPHIIRLNCACWLIA